MPEPTPENLTVDRGRRWPAAGLVVAPASFVAAWAVGGAITPDHSPVHDAISSLAAVGAPHRVVMNTGFVAYGVGVLAGSVALRSSFLRRCWPVLAVNGVATLAVAATPLDRSATIDALHAVAAAVGYVSIAVLPLVAVGPLRSGNRRRAAALSVVAGAVSAGCLAATTLSEANGLFQRIGLGAGDLWLAVTGLALLRRRR